jgi:hypothetical protein
MQQNSRLTSHSKGKSYMPWPKATTSQVLIVFSFFLSSPKTTYSAIQTFTNTPQVASTYRPHTHNLNSEVRYCTKPRTSRRLHFRRHFPTFTFPFSFSFRVSCICARVGPRFPCESVLLSVVYFLRLRC